MCLRRFCLPSTQPGLRPMAHRKWSAEGPMKWVHEYIISSLPLNLRNEAIAATYLFVPCFVFKSVMRHQEIISASAPGEALGNAPLSANGEHRFWQGAVLFGQPCPHPPTLHTKAA